MFLKHLNFKFQNNPPGAARQPRQADDAQSGPDQELCSDSQVPVWTDAKMSLQGAQQQGAEAGGGGALSHSLISITGTQGACTVSLLPKRPMSMETLGAAAQGPPSISPAPVTV